MLTAQQLPCVGHVTIKLLTAEESPPRYRGSENSSGDDCRPPSSRGKPGGKPQKPKGQARGLRILQPGGTSSVASRGEDEVRLEALTTKTPLNPHYSYPDQNGILSGNYPAGAVASHPLQGLQAPNGGLWSHSGGMVPHLGRVWSFARVFAEAFHDSK
jgi:hypothetical protein